MARPSFAWTEKTLKIRAANTRFALRPLYWVIGIFITEYLGGLGFALLQRSAHPHDPSARLASGPRRKPIPLGASPFRTLVLLLARHPWRAKLKNKCIDICICSIIF